MARDAVRFELHLGSRPHVTPLAFQLGVSAEQRESGLLGVVEFPQPPSIRRVTGFALVTHAPLVHVLRLVAADAAGIRNVESPLRMTLLARDGDVQAQEREFRQIVIEIDDLLPTFGNVAFLAPDAKPRGVHVARSMAAHAVRWKLVCAQRCSVTGVAVHLRMEADELPATVARVIERRRLPLLVAMTMRAVRSEPARVRILTLVAAKAVLGQLVVQIAGSVAVLAVELGMRALQCKARFLGVIESRGLPSGRAVAVRAFRAALSFMYVIRSVARDALGRCSFVPVAEMALDAPDGLVPVVQGEGCLVVIEFEVLPDLRVMAGGAVASQLALVRFLCLVTANALVRGVAVRFLRLVAALAGHSGMCTLKGKVGAAMVELLAAEFHDIRVPSLMLGVAGPALCRLDAAQPPVKSGVSGNVGPHRLVTGEAQLRLTRTVAAVMAVLAILLVFLMGRGELARHEEGFGIHGITPPRRQHTQGDSNEQECSPSSGSHRSDQQRQ